MIHIVLTSQATMSQSCWDLYWDSISKQWRHSVASDLGLHCLPMSHKKDTRLILVDIKGCWIWYLFFILVALFSTECIMYESETMH